ncbi:kelch-like protein 20 [Oppia nitens]|uniref:kelch-like protein 20 n=1 Tax=Oppia nitens TaxID=1686743 RepID=UPI0023DA12C5|nr:kelch-like protein 20 [Oppia nitens]
MALMSQTISGAATVNELSGAVSAQVLSGAVSAKELSGAVGQSVSTLYICGGFSGMDTQSKCYQFNQNTNPSNKWQPIKSMSSERTSFSLVNYRNQLYAIGGEAYEISRNVASYNVKTNSWQSAGLLAYPTSSMGATVLNDTLYVCGGTSSGHSYEACEQYFVDRNEWYLTLKPMLTDRHNLELVAHSDGCMYAIGGNSYKNSSSLKTMERFDPKTQKWTQMADMYTKRYEFGAASFMEKIYVCGGMGNLDWNLCESYDPKINQWTKIASMNTRRDNFRLIAFNDNLYAMGGYPCN